MRWLAPAAAWTAALLGALYAAISAYWGAGGTWLLDTIGGSLESRGRAGDAAVLAAVWAAVVLKLVAAVLSPLAIRSMPRGRRRVVRTLAWIAAGVLTLYGLVLTTVGLLVQAGAIAPAVDADQRALAWHAYLWDPWFPVWGLLVVGAMTRSRGRNGLLAS